MSVFSTNQARQFYVASAIESSDRITSASSTGEIKCLVGSNANGVPQNFWFEYMSPAGPVRSDIINVNNVRSIKATNATDMHRPLNAIEVTVKDDIKDSSYIIGGLDCILNITISNYQGAGTEYRINKFGAVHTISTWAASDFYKAMAKSLAGAFARDAQPILEAYVYDSVSSAYVKVEKSTNLSSVTATKVVVKEAVQPYKRGKVSDIAIDFDMYTNTVIVGTAGTETHWGTVTKLVNDSWYAKNGRTTADLEWFCMGERGDIYRGMGYPNNFDTEYLVNPASEYDYVDIHYYFQGEGNSVQQSEKTITIVAPYVSPTHILATLFPANLTAALNDKGMKMYPSTIGDLTDVSITTPSNGQVLKYDGTDKVWENGADAIA